MDRARGDLREVGEKEGWVTTTDPGLGVLYVVHLVGPTTAQGHRDGCLSPSILDHQIIFSCPFPSMSDPRFARLKTDPRFRKIKKNNHKVVVDERFKSIFQDDEKAKKRRSKGSGLFAPHVSWLPWPSIKHKGRC